MINIENLRNGGMIVQIGITKNISIEAEIVTKGRIDRDQIAKNDIIKTQILESKDEVDRVLGKILIFNQNMNIGDWDLGVKVIQIAPQIIKKRDFTHVISQTQNQEEPTIEENHQGAKMKGSIVKFHEKNGNRSWNHL